MLWISVEVPYQSIFCFILIQGTNSCPIKIAHNWQSRRIKFIVGWYDSKKMGKTFVRKHWMSIGVGDLKIEYRFICLIIMQMEKYDYCSIFYLCFILFLFRNITWTKFQCFAALAIWSVTGLQAAPKRINFFGSMWTMSKKAFSPTPGLH